jgi:hypothetical protein
LHLLQFGAARPLTASACQGCASRQAVRWRRDFARFPGRQASPGEDIRRAIFDTGRAVWRVRQRSHLFAEAFTLPLSSGVTIISIVPNGQATTQALQPMHFC